MLLMYGNVLFLMTVRVAFTANLSAFSQFPAVCFTVDRVEFDEQNELFNSLTKTQQ